jgi:hypothetical protein
MGRASEGSVGPDQQKERTMRSEREANESLAATVRLLEQGNVPASAIIGLSDADIATLQGMIEQERLLRHDRAARFLAS